MKTISIAPGSAEVNALLAQARQEDILVRTADGTQFMLTAVDDFDEEGGWDAEMIADPSFSPWKSLLKVSQPSIR